MNHRKTHKLTTLKRFPQYLLSLLSLLSIGALFATPTVSNALSCVGTPSENTHFLWTDTFLTLLPSFIIITLVIFIGLRFHRHKWDIGKISNTFVASGIIWLIVTSTVTNYAFSIGMRRCGGLMLPNENNASEIFAAIFSAFTAITLTGDWFLLLGLIGILLRCYLFLKWLLSKFQKA